MTPLDVAKYLRCFQKAVATRKVKSRMVRRDSRFEDNLAELIRSVLPKAYFRLIRRRRGYELMWTGTVEQARRFRDRVAAWPHFNQVVQMGMARFQPTQWIGQPTEELLDQAVALQPVLVRFRREEAQRTDGAAVEPPTQTVHPYTAGVEHGALEDAPEIEECDEDAPGETRLVVAAEVTPAANPQHVAAAIAEAMRARAAALAPPDQNAAAFQTDGARRFAERLARANRGRS